MEFVTLEIAKKLKEKGFREKCLTCYDVDDNAVLLYNTQYPDGWFCCQYTDLLESHNVNGSSALDSSGNYADAPTISQVLKWLREEKGIYVVIEPFPTMATKNKIHWSWSVKRYSDGANMEHLVIDDVTYATYEQAAFAAIEYVVDNLI